MKKMIMLNDDDYEDNADNYDNKNAIKFMSILFLLRKY